MDQTTNPTDPIIQPVEPTTPAPAINPDLTPDVTPDSTTAAPLTPTPTEPTQRVSSPVPEPEVANPSFTTSEDGVLPGASEPEAAPVTAAQPEPALTADPMMVVPETAPDESVAAPAEPVAESEPEAAPVVSEETATAVTTESAEPVSAPAGSAPLAAEKKNPSLISRLLGLVDL